MSARVKHEFLKPICTVASKEQGVLEVLFPKYKAWLSKAKTELHNGHGQMLVVRILSLWAPPSALHFFKMQKAILHQVTYGKVLHLTGAMCICGGFVFCLFLVAFFFFFL